MRDTTLSSIVPELADGTNPRELDIFDEIMLHYSNLDVAIGALVITLTS